MQSEVKKATKNTAMLYLMNIAKMVFPLVTLPYLTRVLSVEGYAGVAYVKAVMQYAQIVMMFGFTLSATKDIVKANGDKKQIEQVTSAVMLAKVILAVFAGIVIFVMTLFIPLLKERPIYTFLAFSNIVITEMLADFLFQGLDRMEVITIRFVLSKLISTAFVILFVKGEKDVLLIPIFDILGSGVALILVLHEIRKLGIRIVKVSLNEAVKKLKESAVFFMSNMATTAFGALNTLLVGIFIEKQFVSYWSLSMQLVSAVQSMYSPISTGVYPTMIRTKSIKLIKRVHLIFMPMVFAGCIFCMVFAERIVAFVGGVKYIPGADVFRALIPVLFISFPAIMLGWPALGAIGRHTETSQTTLVTAVVQVIGLALLLATKRFNLINIALLRGVTELFMLILRGGYCYKFRREFNS